MQPMRVARVNHGPERNEQTHVLVWDDLDALHVTGGLENLSENFFRNSWVQTTNIERSLVWLRCGSSDQSSSTAW